MVLGMAEGKKTGDDDDDGSDTRKRGADDCGSCDTGSGENCHHDGLRKEMEGVDVDGIGKGGKTRGTKGGKKGDRKGDRKGDEVKMTVLYMKETLNGKYRRS